MIRQRVSVLLNVTASLLKNYVFYCHNFKEMIIKVALKRDVVTFLRM